jgi:hypothetical protein
MRGAERPELIFQSDEFRLDPALEVAEGNREHRSVAGVRFT